MIEAFSIREVIILHPTSEDEGENLFVSGNFFLIGTSPCLIKALTIDSSLVKKELCICLPS